MKTHNFSAYLAIALCIISGAVLSLVGPAFITDGWSPDIPVAGLAAFTA